MALCKLWTAEATKDTSIVLRSIERSLQAFGYDCMKPAQTEAVQAILEGQDAFVNVPTGYGKSLVYQILPFCASFLLERVNKAHGAVPVVLVVSPLVALMQDQAHKLKQVQGANPILLSEESARKDSEVLDAAWTHILASPEALLDSPKWKDLLLNSELMNRLVAVVIDEAHCIVKW